MAIATPPTGVSNAELIRWSFEQLTVMTPAVCGSSGATTSSSASRTAPVAASTRSTGYFEDTFAALPDLHTRGHLDRRAGRRRLRALAAHRAPTTALSRGSRATGKPIELDGIDHFVLRDGRIVSNFVVFDQMQYSRQLGILPAQDSVGDKAMKAAFNAARRCSRRS